MSKNSVPEASPPLLNFTSLLLTNGHIIDVEMTSSYFFY